MTPAFYIGASPLGRGQDVVVTGDWTADAIAALASPEVDGLTLNYAVGFREPSLEFLDAWPLRRLNILDRKLKDLTPIYRLAATLEDLSVQSAPGSHLDLTRLPRLTRLGAAWPQIWDTLPALPNLEDLYLAGYRDRDLTHLSANPMLKNIRVKHYPRIESLDGLSALPRLEMLGIYGGSRLHDIQGLDGSPTFPRLHSLELDTCRHFPALDALKHQTDLTSLNLGNCGDINSLGPIAGLVKLRRLYLYESTRILDNDLQPLTGLTELTDLRIMNRRGYRPSVAEVKAGLGLDN